jgi:hypothetical protein
MSDINSTDSAAMRVARVSPDWPIGASLPPNPNIQLFFWGIMGFRYDALRRTCEIGFHHGSPTHRVKIVVLENFLTEIYSSEREGGLPVQSKIDFEVVGKSSDVSFFQTAGALDRTVVTAYNEHDFRWLIDVEADDFYGHQLPRQRRVYRKRLIVNNGTFFTLAPTCATFDVRGGVNEHDSIHIAKYMAASLTLAANECVSLKVGGVEKLPANTICGGIADRSFQFFFVNTCDTSSDQSDFHLNFDAIALPHDQRFELILKQPCQIVPPDPFKQFLKVRENPLQQVVFNTDAAPCMGVGFGSGFEFPTFPPG